jgi:hypothetical protein
MTWNISIHLINLFFAGTLAGIEIASHYGLINGVEFLSDRSQIQLRQALIRRLRVLVPSFFLPTILSTLYVVAVDGLGVRGTLLEIALLGYAVWFLARLVTTVRINKATLGWDLDAPPEGWRVLVAHAEQFHIVSTWAVSAAFALLLAAFAIAN